MSEIKRLISLAESETELTSIAHMLRWWHDAQRVLNDGGEPTEDRIKLAYWLGRIEGCILPQVARVSKAKRIAAGRREADLGDADRSRMQEGADRARQLQQDGVRGYVSQAAREYDVDRKTMGRWLKATRRTGT